MMRNVFNFVLIFNKFEYLFIYQEIEDQRWLAEGASFYPAPYSQNIDKFEVIPSRYKNKQKINPRNHEDTNLMGNIKIEQKVKR